MKELCFACEHCKIIKDKERNNIDTYIYKCKADKIEIILDINEIEKDKCIHFHPED